MSYRGRRLKCVSLIQIESYFKSRLDKNEKRKIFWVLQRYFKIVNKSSKNIAAKLIKKSI